MAVMAFFFLMVILFFIASFFIILNVIFIIIWKVRKRNGRFPKKRYVVIPIIFLILNLILEAIPVGWLIIVRTANSTNKIVRAESGKVLYWNTSGNDYSFEMNDTDYVELPGSGSEDTWKLGKPVANIRYKSAEEGLNKFMNFLSAYNDTSTLYPIFNEKDFKLYTIGSNIYCPKNQKDSVSEYYNDLSNYNAQNCRYERYVFIKVKDEKAKKDKTVNDSDFIFKNVTFNQDVFKKLYEIMDTQESETIKIPEKYENIRKARKPGTPVWGYDNIILYMYSKDKVMYKEIELGLINDQIYCIKGSSGDNIIGYRLTPEINEYLKGTIFLK